MFVGMWVRGYVSFYFIFLVKPEAPHVGNILITSMLQ